jgi:hypothetical protein
MKEKEYLQSSKQLGLRGLVNFYHHRFR